jgi:hypothetical protein
MKNKGDIEIKKPLGEAFFMKRITCYTRSHGGARYVID